MQNVLLVTALPYIASVVVFLIGVIAYFLKRYLEANDKEHIDIRLENVDSYRTFSAANEKHHEEIYERLRAVELVTSAIKAQHDINH